MRPGTHHAANLGNNDCQGIALGLELPQALYLVGGFGVVTMFRARNMSATPLLSLS